MEGGNGARAAEGAGPDVPAARPAPLALWVPAIYALVSSAWIALSDAFVAAVSPSVEEQAAWSVLKGFGFVAATTLALHAGLRWALARERRAQEELHRAERALRRYQLLADYGRDVILFIRPEDGRILDVNAAAAETYGYSRDELRSLSVFDLRGPGSSAVVASQIADADAGGVRFEAVHHRKDGSAFPVEVSSEGATIDGSRVLISVVRDVTSRKATEEALRETDERLALALGAAGLGTWHAVPFGPMEWSPRCREIFGVGDREVIPDFESFLLLVHPDDREQVRRAVARWLDASGDGRYHDEYRCLRPDGGVRWVVSHGKARFEVVGGIRRPVQLAGTLLDVTELKAVQAQLMQSDRLASVGMLAAGVAHEINNPLAYLTAALEFAGEHAHALTGGPAGARGEVLQALAEAREGAARIRHVVRDLTTFSRTQEERRARVELGPVIESAIHMTANEIRHRARLVREYGQAPAVLANEARLGQVLLNLLINAAQAIPEGHVDENEIRVVTGTDSDGRAVVEVRDSGPGIPVGLADRIFDPFFTTKPKGVGTGLGLSICRSIVVALGGEITAESRTDPHGASFRVVLPAAPAEAVREPRPRAESPGVASGRRGRVLVVDDEPIVAAALRRVLASEHDVVVLTRARDARDAISRGERFDVILCDLMMPQMTGMELHAALERLAPEQASRMVVMTGGAFTDGAREFLDRVSLPRFEKPFDSSSLRATVRGLVSAPSPRPS